MSAIAVQKLAGDLTVSGDVSITGNLNSTGIATTFVNLVYPVGAIYISYVSTNPGTIWTDTTWTAHAAGRVIVSLDSGDGDFDSPGETGGSKTHTLTSAQMDAHQHDFKSFPGNNENSNQWVSFFAGNYTALCVTIGGGQANYVKYSGYTGSGGSYPIVQPYIVAYMWRRTA
jgi:hypothetical protein